MHYLLALFFKIRNTPLINHNSVVTFKGGGYGNLGGTNWTDEAMCR